MRTKTGYLKSQFFFVFFSFILASLPAQTTLFLGPEMEAEAKFTAPNPSGILDGNFYTYRWQNTLGGGDKCFFEKYGPGFDLKLKKEIDLELNGRPSKFIESMVWGGQILFFTQQSNSKYDHSILYVQAIDPNTLQFKGVPKAIMDVTLNMRGKPATFSFDFSPNRQLIMFQATIPNINKERESLHAAVFTSSLEKLWDSKMELPVSGRHYELTSSTVDDGGDIYISGRLYEKPPTVSFFRGVNIDFEYVVYSFKSGGKEMQEFHLGLPDRFITDFRLGTGPAGNMVGLGFWSDKGTWNIKGCILFSLDVETKAIKVKSVTNFEQNFLQLFMTERQAAKGKGLLNYEIRDIYVKDDHEVLMVAEQYFVYTETRYNGNNVYTVYHYLYNDIIVANFSADGEVEWVTKVPKFQHTTNDGGYFSSFGFAVFEGKTFLVFNDNPKNLNITEADRLENYNGKENLAVMVTIDEYGKWTKSVLFDRQEENVTCRPKCMQQFEPGGDLIVYAEKRKTYRFGNIKFK